VTAVHFWWIGAAGADHGVLDVVRADAEAAFSLPIKLWFGRERPDDAFDPRRQQHSSTRILHWLQAQRPRHADKVVGITDVDLFIPILTFVYGEAQLDGEAAVVSTARLTAANGTRSANFLLAARLAKECIHELGHTFGLIHCHQPGCVMGRSVTLAQVDAKDNTLCPDCWTKYRELQQRQKVTHE
jgi:archaemetzincin